MIVAKTCSHCGAEKPVGEFQRYWNNQRQAYYRMAICKPCRSAHRKAAGESERRNARRRERYASDPEYRQRQRDAAFRFFRGVDRAWVESALADQLGCCAICGTNDPGPKGWCVDHDHECCPGKRSCGKCNRGVLCTRCNVGIGMFFDAPDTLEAAAIYLRAWAEED